MRGLITRREFVKGAVALSALSLTSQTGANNSTAKKPHIAVIGAGAFGGWTAYRLLKMGARVSLFDAWGPGNSRASSGGETRVIRGIYGPTELYVKWSARSLQLWREHERAWKRKLYTQTGALWMVRQNRDYETASLPFMKSAGLEYEEIAVQDAARRFPQIRFDGISWVYLEKDAGYLLARQACHVLVEAFGSEGGEYQMLSVQPGIFEGRAMQHLNLSDGSRLKADAYVFACGPWLGKLFSAVLGKSIAPTRQEVFYFGTAAGDQRYSEKQLPVWVDHGERLIYGIPGNEHRGFKIADDTRGADFDPTSGDRTPTPSGIQAARDFLAQRFPDLKDAPLIESRVCQYENSPDSHFIIDRHPEAENVWLVGGGSGHGYKHGPVLGEFVANVVLGKREPEPLFQLARFHKKSIT